jgi:MSHA biogenesis protein MshK
MSGRIVEVVLLAALAFAAAPAHAQALVDPTRPPNAQAGEAPDAAPGGTQLQSILIASNRRLAIINGTTVALGGTVGDAKVVKITETEVTLKKGDETEVLRLYPGVDKQPVKRGARGSRGGAVSQQLQGRPTK